MLFLELWSEDGSNAVVAEQKQLLVIEHVPDSALEPLLHFLEFNNFILKVARFFHGEDSIEQVHNLLANLDGVLEFEPGSVQNHIGL